MKSFFRILGITFWVLGIVWIVYIVGAVFSRTEGYSSIVNLIGAFGFHTVCMFLGGVFMIKSVQKAPTPAEKSTPLTQAQ